jgi:hypothetical protein
LRDDNYVRVLALFALAHAIVLGVDHLGVDHLGVDHLGVDHLGVDHLGVDHLGVDHRVNAAEIVELVFTSLYSDHDDERLAEELLNAKMTQQLSPLVVAYFQNLGVTLPFVAWFTVILRLT